MFKRVVLEKRHNRLGKEEKLLERQAEMRGIPVVTTYEKTVARGHFILNRLTSWRVVLGSCTTPCVTSVSALNTTTRTRKPLNT